MRYRVGRQAPGAGLDLPRLRHRPVTHCLLIDLAAYDKHVEGKGCWSSRFMGCSTRGSACFTKCVEISARTIAKRARSYLRWGVSLHAMSLHGDETADLRRLSPLSLPWGANPEGLRRAGGYGSASPWPSAPVLLVAYPNNSVFRLLSTEYGAVQLDCCAHLVEN